MLRDSLSRLYRKVLVTQAISVLILALAAVIVADVEAAISTLAGGGAALMGSLVYAALARESKIKAAPASRVFARHVVAETGKVAVVILAALLAMASGWFIAIWLLAGLVVALLGHGLAVFIIR